MSPETPTPANFNEDELSFELSTGRDPQQHVPVVPPASPPTAVLTSPVPTIASTEATTQMPATPTFTAAMPAAPPSAGVPPVGVASSAIKPAESPSRPNRLLIAAGSALLLLLVVAGIGTVFLNGGSETAITAGDDSNVVFEDEFAVEDDAEVPDDDASTGPVVIDDSGPSPMPDSTLEPVAFVARQVGPSVVLLQTSIGQGSGIIYDESGLIVTNAHVVGNANTLEVVLASGFRLDGTVVGTDPQRDVAVVSFDPTEAEFGVAEIGLLETVEVGQLAVAIGSPFGLEQTVTSGIVSALGRPIPGLSIPVQMVQTDASINPGNSGGALADREGRVIGMNTSIRTDGVSSTNAGVGFAIPADTFLDIANRLVNGESLESGYLGVSISDPQIGAPGAVVVGVEPDTPAAAGGVEVGDLIVSVNGQPITDTNGLRAAITLGQPGSATTVEVLRNGVSIELEVILSSQ